MFIALLRSSPRRSSTPMRPPAGSTAAANIRPLVDYVRQFSKERPFTAAAVAGVLGIAVINTLRGK